jgi:hypothetical protein
MIFSCDPPHKDSEPKVTVPTLRTRRGAAGSEKRCIADLHDKQLRGCLYTWLKLQLMTAVFSFANDAGIVQGARALRDLYVAKTVSTLCAESRFPTG